MEWHHVYALLHVVEKAHGHPELHPLRDAAMAELRKQADIVKKGGQVGERPEPKEATEPTEEPRPDGERIGRRRPIAEDTTDA